MPLIRPKSFTLAPRRRAPAATTPTAVLRIGALARATGLGPDALRHYERLGILPRARRTAGNFREYPASAIKRVHATQAALAIGFTLRELGQIFADRDRGQAPCQRVHDLAAGKLTALDRQIATLTTLRRILRTSLHAFKRRLARTPRGQTAGLLEALAEGWTRGVGTAFSLTLVIAALACASFACAKPPPPREVIVSGALRAIMHEGRTGPAIALPQILPDRSLFAVGALTGLQGEITIIDGTVWTSVPAGHGGVRTTRSTTGMNAAAPATADAATLLVRAQVPAWRAFSLGAAGQSFSQAALADEIERIARTAQVDINRPFAFLIEGPVRDLKWHVLGGTTGGSSHADHMKSATTGTLTSPRVTLVGFFSRAHAGVFTHMGEAIHQHVVATAPDLSAHVDDVVVLGGATLKLPN